MIDYDLMHKYSVARTGNTGSSDLAECFGICPGLTYFEQKAKKHNGNVSDYLASYPEDPNQFKFESAQSCFFSTEPFDSMVVNGCGPGKHGSGYPIIGNPKALGPSFFDERFLFYGQENLHPDPSKAAAKKRELYARIEPKTPPVSFNTSGPSAFIQPDELFVSDNAREGNNTDARDCNEHEQCVLSNSPRANGLNKGEDIGHHRLYTFYFEGTTPTFDDEDLGLSNVVRSVPTCGARMVSRISSGRGMHRGCVDTPGWVSDFDVRTIAGDETAHAPIFSAYLSKEPDDIISKSEFELVWSTLWGQIDELDPQKIDKNVDHMKKKLTSGPLPSAFYRQMCRSKQFIFGGTPANFDFGVGSENQTHRWDNPENYFPFDEEGKKQNWWALSHSPPFGDEFENACRWLDGSEGARAFGEQILNRTFFGKHYDRVIDLVKNEQRPFVKGTHGKILNNPSSGRLYSLKDTNVTLPELMKEVDGKTCGWFRKYYCYEPHFTEERAQDEHSEKSLFDFYGPGRHWCVLVPFISKNAAYKIGKLKNRKANCNPWAQCLTEPLLLMEIFLCC